MLMKATHFFQNRIVENNPFEFKLNLFTEKPKTHEKMIKKTLINN